MNLFTTNQNYVNVLTFETFLEMRFKNRTQMYTRAIYKQIAKEINLLLVEVYKLYKFKCVTYYLTSAEH